VSTVAATLGLVTREKRGQWVWDRIVTSRLDPLRGVLS
jgi:hypothetical protein